MTRERSIRESADAQEARGAARSMRPRAARTETGPGARRREPTPGGRRAGRPHRGARGALGPPLGTPRRPRPLAPWLGAGRASAAGVPAEGPRVACRVPPPGQNGAARGAGLPGGRPGLEAELQARVRFEKAALRRGSQERRGKWIRKDSGWTRGPGVRRKCWKLASR